MLVDSPRFFYFDLGRVLVHFDVAQMCRQMAAVAQTDPQRVFQALFDSDLQFRVERGEISDAEFLDDFCRLTGSRSDVSALARAASEIFVLNTTIVPVVAQLRAAGFRLGILSNTCHHHWEYCRQQFRLLDDLFSVHALSFRLGTAKPEASIFASAAALAGVAPQEILFIDDLLENVAGAEQAGFQAVQYTSTPLLVAELHRREARFNY